MFGFTITRRNPNGHRHGRVQQVNGHRDAQVTAVSTLHSPHCTRSDSGN